jgi:cardiolipin synthase
LSLWYDIDVFWEGLVLTAVFLQPLLLVATIFWVLMTKRESTSAVAWCLVIFFLPFLGALLFALFGYQHVSRPLARKRRHRQHFQRTHPPARLDIPGGQVKDGEAPGEREAIPETTWQGLGRLARRFGNFPVTAGNRVTFYQDGSSAFAAMLEAVEQAGHHVHLEFFIFQPDGLGRKLIELLARKAAAGVEVRLLYDAIGSRRLPRRFLRPLLDAGGQAQAFLPINPLRRRFQINLRDHRKILLVDGRVGFTGGLNVGEEYLGLNRRYGYWRDSHLRLEGPAVNELQMVFSENWDFAAEEDLKGTGYFPPARPAGAVDVQVIESGPDRPLKSIREMYFAAILRARQRVWIATPYFVPDAGLLDALCLAGRLGLDVRLLGQYHPDKWIPYFAGRYYWANVLEAGVQVYQYTRGMMHSKVMLVDGQWASVGSANLDNRSLHLNFEVNCLLYTPAAVAELEDVFRHDLQTSIRLRPRVYARRPLAGRIVENASRLLSPVL